MSFELRYLTHHLKVNKLRVNSAQYQKKMEILEIRTKGRKVYFQEAGKCEP